MKFLSLKSEFSGYNDTVQYFKELLNKMGEWPILEKNWSEENFDWLQSFKILRSENLSIPYPVDIEEFGMSKVSEHITAFELIEYF